VALAGPRRQQQEDPRPGVGRDRSPFVGVEHAKRPSPGVEQLTAGLDARVAFDDQNKRMLFDLMVTERLAGLEHDEDRAGRFVGVEHDGRAAAAFDLDLVKVPAPHERLILTWPVSQATP